jgi:hypothetical protein
MYANDVIAIKQAEKRKTLKLITRHTDAELNDAIEKAHRKWGEDFYTLLHGIDAYQERRKRRGQRQKFLHAQLPNDFGLAKGDQ